MATLFGRASASVILIDLNKYFAKISLGLKSVSYYILKCKPKNYFTQLSKLLVGQGANGETAAVFCLENLVRSYTFVRRAPTAPWSAGVQKPRPVRPLANNAANIAPWAYKPVVKSLTATPALHVAFYKKQTLEFMSYDTA
uniref:Uncharacterized protein n=1 Tax=Romanomermis culicivorax TaxID=13658 RepID=A0A915J332_ROMCU